MYAVEQQVKEYSSELSKVRSKGRKQVYILGCLA